MLVIEGSWERNEVKGHIHKLCIGEQQESGKDVYQRSAHIPLLVKFAEEASKWLHYYANQPIRIVKPHENITGED